MKLLDLANARGWLFCSQGQLPILQGAQGERVEKFSRTIKREMIMAQEDYCSYEVAKLLKEKGFDVPCLAHWFIGTDRNFSISNTPQNWNEIKTDLDWLSCPTHQMTMKWLRETYGIFISIKPYDSYYEDKYEFSIYKKQNTVIFEWEVLDIEDSLFDGYENTVEVAIKYCLKNLI